VGEIRSGTLVQQYLAATLAQVGGQDANGFGYRGIAGFGDQSDCRE
jgi:hypothetical protein